MAKDVAEDDEEAGEGKAAPAADKSSIKKIILIAAGALALVGVSIGGTILTTSLIGSHDTVAEGKAKTKKKAKAAAEENADANADEEAAPEDAADAGDENADAADAGEEGAPATKQTTYLDFEQPFVVNFMDGEQMRYLQVSVAVMSHDATMAEVVKRHMPLIRNNLVMLFSSQSREQIMTREGKEKIRADAQAEVQKILKEQTGKPVIEALYLTSFVMQ